MEPRQTPGSMLLSAILAATVALVAFVALMVIGGYAFAGAFGIAFAVFAAVSVVLVIGMHRAPTPVKTDA
ncbi:MAG: hypothetical protein AAF667_11470 [Pseudomonadota bacterium]